MNLHSIYHSGHTNLYSYPECIKFPLSPHLSATLLSHPFDDGHSNRCKVIFIVVLIYISLMVSDVENLFMYLLAISMFSLEKYVVRSLAHFSTRLFVLLPLSCMSSLYILDINPLSNRWCTHIFSQFRGCFYILLVGSFAVPVALK